jgi:uncharacterized SAM-binding protein YcdF (DUF218 family)
LGSAGQLEHRGVVNSSSGLRIGPWSVLLKPKPSERWLLVTSALHMPRAVGCFRAAGFQVEPYPVEFRTGSLSHHTQYATWSAAFFNLDFAMKEWIGLIAYRLMGRINALFPGP